MCKAKGALDRCLFYYISKIENFCGPVSWVDAVYRKPEIQAKVILPPSQETNRHIKQDVSARRSRVRSNCFLPTDVTADWRSKENLLSPPPSVTGARTNCTVRPHNTTYLPDEFPAKLALAGVRIPGRVEGQITERVYM